MTTALPYRPGVGMMLLNKQHKVFVARRIDTTAEAWQMPQGGIDEGETPEQAVLRELAEETGIETVEILAESRDWLTYDLPPDLAKTLWGGKFLGQRQKWFALRFSGTDSDINIATAHPEFCEWKWVFPHELPGLIVPFKRELYAAIVEEFQRFWKV